MTTEPTAPMGAYAGVQPQANNMPDVVTAPRRLSWTQPICLDCYERRQPGRKPHRITLDPPERETCCDCGMDTLMGVFVRLDPATVQHPAMEPCPR